MPPRANFRTDVNAALLEYVGTTVFLLLGLGGVQASKTATSSASQETPTLDKIFFIAACMSFSLTSSAWLFYRVTGGLFNPCISLALVLVGVIKPVRFVLYCLAQMAGAVTASALVWALTPGELGGM